MSPQLIELLQAWYRQHYQLENPSWTPLQVQKQVVVELKMFFHANSTKIDKHFPCRIR